MPREYNLRKDQVKNKAPKKATLCKTPHAPAQQQAKKKTPTNAEPNQHQKTQQSMLDAFSDSFSQHASSTPLIQELKQHLFNRDFLAAFSRQDLLEAYALRWSPSRALAYFDLFCDCKFLTDALEDLFLKKRSTARREVKGNALIKQDPASNEVSRRPSLLESGRASLEGGTNGPDSNDGVKVTCLGAGSGAEVVAFAGYQHWLRYGDSSSQDDPIEDGDPPALKPLILRTIDIASWSSVVTSLVAKVTSPPKSSDESALSPQITTTHPPLTDHSSFQASFSQLDVLAPDFEPLALSLQSSALVTLMFTLNELYTTSMSRTTTLLLTLTSVMESGSLLLVVDSPGSYSTVKLNKRVGVESLGAGGAVVEERRYPMQWLLNHTLMEAAGVGSSVNASGERRWEKVHGQDSRWFRLPKGLAYPIELEDMRFQVHLYRKL